MHIRNARLLQKHLANLYMEFAPSDEPKYRAYLKALIELFSAGTSVLAINNVEEFLTLMAGSLRCHDLERHDPYDENVMRWDRVLWCIIDELPRILHDYPADRTRQNIRILVLLMPEVAVECKAKCAAHMRAYLKQNPIDAASDRALETWIQAFKAAV